MRLGGLLLDFSRHLLDESALQLLIQLAEEAKLSEAIREQFRGEPVNVTENRAALHMAFRSSIDLIPLEFRQTAGRAHEKLCQLVTGIRDGTLRGATGQPCRHVVQIGIGGSHLGAALAVNALCDGSVDVRFLAEFSSERIQQELQSLDLASTLFVVVSKSFRTTEPLQNAEVARSWVESALGPGAVAKHFVAATSNLEAARAFGIHESGILEIPSWVGGRYSVWSPAGIAVAIAAGPEAYREFLHGASLVDRHALDAAPSENLPMLMALLELWNSTFLGAESHAVLSYHPRLGLLTSFLQQLEMESNGKSALVSGGRSAVPTCPVVWGGAETGGQHSFHQLLHQGGRKFSADLVGTVRQRGIAPEEQQWTLSQLMAQASLFFTGHGGSSVPDHKHIGGRHGASILLLDRLAPETLGTLLALYEHKVACLGWLWGVNSFDQWGVERGKALARDLERAFRTSQESVGLNPIDADLLHAIIHRTAFLEREDLP